MLELLRRLNDEFHKTIMIVTHDAKAAEELRAKFRAVGCEAEVSLAHGGDALIGAARKAVQDQVHAMAVDRGFR